MFIVFCEVDAEAEEKMVKVLTIIGCIKSPR